MDTTLLLRYIPNWQRFCEVYKPENDFIEAFLHRLSLIEDIGIYENMSKHVNVELGILLLHHEELDESSYENIMHLFSGKEA